MPVDPELLAILACPACDERPPVALCRLKDDVSKSLVEKYREKLKDEEPVVTEGLQCSVCGRVYAIVSDIPVMLVDEALGADARAA
ncbi:MAG TPA: Trm112 family protein [Thermoanaerobaculia bacterium]|nr:Trm112 family protein [Thermoanaerobaculia bacterium]